VFNAARPPGRALFINSMLGEDWERIRMSSSMVLEPPVEGGLDVDPIEEIRLRTWARKNYTPAHQRDDTLHPIILDEMKRKDEELN
jgi:hypothetical protein